MLIGARLNWLLSHGKGKTWGEPGSKKFIQIDIEPKEMDSNVEIVAPLVGDIGSCVSALLEGIDGKWPAPPADWTNAVKAKKEENIAKMAPRLMKNSAPMDFVRAAQPALRPIDITPSFKNKAYAALKNAIVAMDIYCNREDIRP